MRLPRLFSREISISAGSSSGFLAISLVPCGLLTLVIFYISARSLERSVQLDSVVSEANRCH
ncbi:MAG: hypothetical protein U0794_05440 [Isosphaeraceae bacterium]